MRYFFLLFLISQMIICLFIFLIDWESLYSNFFHKELIDNLSTSENSNLKYNFLYFIPFSLTMLFIRTTIISLVIFTGLFFVTVIKGTKSLGIIFTSVCIAEFVFVIEKAINLVVFMAKPDLTLEFIQQFSPVSLYGLLGQDIGVDYLNYFLRSINLYEIAYILVLAYLISDNLELGFSKSLKTTFFSYGSLMACWVVFVTYLILNISP